MNAITVTTGLNVLLTVLSKAAELSTLIQKARDEDRDISAEEWKQLDLDQAEAHASLKESIKKREDEDLINR